MQFGIMFANTGHGSTPDGAVKLVQAAEAGGFTTAWTVEHVVVPSGYESRYPYDPSGKMAGGAEDFDLPDPLIWLTWAAAHTERIELGTGILIVPQRNPVVTAKELATLDHLSGGRLRLGVGAGWLAEEFAAIGVPFDDRGRRLDDHIGAMRALWSQDKASYHGEFVDFDECISRPRPVDGTIPVIVGGHTKVAARRAGRLGDGFMPGSGPIDQLTALVEVARESAREAGRDPEALALYAMAGGAPGDALYQRIEELAGIGVSQVVVPAYPPDALAGIGADLISRFG